MKNKILLATVLAVSLAACSEAQAGMIPLTLVDDGSELWTPTDTNVVLDDSGFEMLFEFGQFNTNDHTFGFYQVDSGGNMLSSLDIFRSTDGVGSGSNLVWDIGSNLASTQYGSIGLGSNLEFGFYFISDGFTAYSQSALNGGTNYMDFFWQSDIYDTNNLYISAWDNDSGINYDQIDVGISDVSRTGPSANDIPEPTSVALFGLALAGFAASKRRKS